MTSPLSVLYITNSIVAETKLFLKELEYFLEMSQVEQKYRLDGVALTLDGYWSIRLGTSAVFPFLVLSWYV